jgi:serine protease AprX
VSGIQDEDGGLKFDGSSLDRSIIAQPLIDEMSKATTRSATVYDLIVDLNLLHRAGLGVARELVYIEIIGYDKWFELGRSQDTVAYLDDLASAPGASDDLRAWEGITSEPLADVVDLAKARYTPQYVYPKLTASQIRQLIAVDGKCATRSLYRIWPDFEVEMMLTKSIATVKANAARAAFEAAGSGIVWAVADTGIDGTHPHFAEHANLDLSGLAPLKHVDFSGASTSQVDESTDPHGHGTHVAGIIAGESPIKLSEPDTWEPERWAGTVERDQQGDRAYSRWQVKKPIAGVAPLTKLVSLRVLNKSGTGKVSSLLAAIGYVQEMNDHGRLLRIHGVNMSVGYGFDPEWFGCGQSPLCLEVNRLVRSGVSVVVAAGNTGYWKRGATEAAINSGLDLTINDPGNAQDAITVGSTHREKPHTFGVSYFSSKGPTGDGRLKPDLVAPGEKVLSCAAGTSRTEIENKLDNGDDGVDYRQESGTSMAAPHVSGAIAAFLSARSEFIGQPQRVKEIFTQSATDLGRDKYFQGHGLVDLMRAMQSV